MVNRYTNHSNRDDIRSYIFFIVTYCILGEFELHLNSLSYANLYEFGTLKGAPYDCLEPPLFYPRSLHQRINHRYLSSNHRLYCHDRLHSP